MKLKYISTILFAIAALFLTSCEGLKLEGPMFAQVIDKDGNTLTYGPNGIEALITKDGVVFKYDKEHGLVTEVTRDGVIFRYDREGGLVATIDLREVDEVQVEPTK